MLTARVCGGGRVLHRSTSVLSAGPGKVTVPQWDDARIRQLVRELLLPSVGRLCFDSQLLWVHGVPMPTGAAATAAVTTATTTHSLPAPTHPAAIKAAPSHLTLPFATPAHAAPFTTNTAATTTVASAILHCDCNRSGMLTARVCGGGRVLHRSTSVLSAGPGKVTVPQWDDARIRQLVRELLLPSVGRLCFDSQLLWVHGVPMPTGAAATAAARCQPTPWRPAIPTLDVQQCMRDQLKRRV